MWQISYVFISNSTVVAESEVNAPLIGYKMYQNISAIKGVKISLGCWRTGC